MLFNQAGLIIFFAISIILCSCDKVSEEDDCPLQCIPANPDIPGTGDPTLEWVTPVAGGTRTEHHVFCSGAAQTEVSYHIYIPEAYNTQPSQKFPVMYWLHGSGQGPVISGIPFLTDYFDNAISEGLIPPMLIVFPNSPVRSLGDRNIITMWVDSKDLKSPVETVVIKELVPHIDATYRTVASREGRALDGFSMGGVWSCKAGYSE